MIFKKLGFEVWGATSNIDDSHEFISKLGVDRHIDKTETDETLSGNKIRALNKEIWAGGLDCVGGNTLVTMIKSCKYGGNIAVVGNIGGD